MPLGVFDEERITLHFLSSVFERVFYRPVMTLPVDGLGSFFFFCSGDICSY